MTQSTDPIKVLLVDDEKSFTKLVKLALEDSGEFEIFIENDPLKAVEAVHAMKPDVIVLDILMPGKSGLDVGVEIAADPGICKIPLMFMSAAVSKDDPSSWRTGVDGLTIKIDNDAFADSTVLVKPVKAGDLMQAIRELNLRAG